MVTDPISDLLTRVRNAQIVGHHTVQVLASKLAGHVLEVLKREGFIENFSAVPNENGPQKMFSVALRYLPTGEPVISRLKRVSSPGRRTYSKMTEFKPIHRGLGISIVSTSQGVMSDREARKRRIGGEILAFVG